MINETWGLLKKGNLHTAFQQAGDPRYWLHQCSWKFQGASWVEACSGAKRFGDDWHHSQHGPRHSKQNTTIEAPL